MSLVPRRSFRISAPSPTASDPAGAFRFASALIAMAAAGGVVGALLEPRLGRRRRAGCALCAATIAVVATRGAVRPRLAATVFLEHPTAALGAGALPMLAAPLFGRRFNALHMLSIVGVGVCTAVHPKRRHPAIVGASAAFWLVQAATGHGSPRELLRDEKLSMTFFMVPLSFWAVGSLTPDVLTAARELGRLQVKLDVAERKEAKLTAYRGALETAFPVVRDALGGARRAAERLSADERREVLRLIHRVSGRLDERAAVLEASGSRSGNVEALLRKRAAVLTALEPEAPPVTVASAGVRVTDARTLALIGSATAAALSNSIRHAETPEHISISAVLEGERVVVVVEDDGGPAGEMGAPSFGSAGLGNLRDQACDLDGKLTWGPRASHGWAQRLELPVETPVAPHGDLIADRMTRLMDSALAATTRACSLMVLSMATEGRQLPKRHLLRSRVCAIAVTVAYEALDRRGSLERWGTPFLAGAAVVSALNPHYEHSLWSGWANAALSRHGLRCTRRTLGLLTAAHVTAIGVSYRGGWREGLMMASHQMTTSVLGPLSIFFGAGRAIQALDRKERALSDSLLATEQMHEIAEAIHSAHPVPAPLERLEQLMSNDHPETAAALRVGRQALAATISELPLDTHPMEFAKQFAETVAARVWPAHVELEVNQDRLDELGRQATVRMEFRRQALRTADRLGDTLVADFPPDWRARNQLERVRLFITGDPRTRSFCVRAAPFSSVDGPTKEIGHMAETLSEAGGALLEGFGDKQLRLSLPVI